MNFEQIIVERRDDALWVILNRPLALNSLTPLLVREFGEALDLAESDPAIRSLVVTGAGRAFCAGVDLIEVREGNDGQQLIVGIDALLHSIGTVFNRLERIQLPTIAAVNGIALAGGLELLLCCDLVIAVDTARFGDAHANYGLLPGGGGSVRLPRRIGTVRAKYLMMTGELAAAADMHDAGLLNKVVSTGELETTVAALAASLAEKSALGLAHMKRLVAHAEDLPLDEALKNELDAMATYSLSHDLREGLAAFGEKRKPQFIGQ